tara:strand:- start:397 stop:693 length:297 start_codon:yes stop_codon:yes gene_type:complete
MRPKKTPSTISTATAPATFCSGRHEKEQLIEEGWEPPEHAGALPKTETLEEYEAALFEFDRRHQSLEAEGTDNVGAYVGYFLLLLLIIAVAAKECGIY